MKKFENNKIFSIPEKDDQKRFIIGKKGDNNLLVVALNPSTADIDKHDPTTRYIENIANLNGFDGWLLFNLCPKRATHPSELQINSDQNLFIDNLTFLNTVLKLNQFDFKHVWLAWGNNIDYKNRQYFIESAYYMYQVFKQYSMGFLSAGINKTSHPIHPSPQSINKKYSTYKNVKLEPFDLKSYINDIKEKTSIRSKIIIDGKLFN